MNKTLTDFETYLVFHNYKRKHIPIKLLLFKGDVYYMPEISTMMILDEN